MPVGTEEITELLDKIIARYKPGGEFGKAELALLERAKTKSLATTAQGLVSAGLAGTTAGVGAGRKWEEEIGMPSKLRLEDIRTERLTQAMGAKAGYIERAATREEQAALAREQMELEEKFRNKQISLQEYLAATDRLRAKAAAGGVAPSALPEGFGEFSPGMETWSERQQRLAGSEGAGTGASFGGTGGGYAPHYRGGAYVGPLDIGEMQRQAAGGDVLFPAGGGEPRPVGMQSLAQMAQKWLAE